MISDQNISALLSGVFAREKRAIARLISLAEAGKEPLKDAMAAIHQRSGVAHIIGITGVPGCGKSTLLSSLVKIYREAGRRIGVVAIDPSSPFSGGAILGDRIRMADLAADDGVFIRSLATRGNLGGLARATMDIVDILDASGFDMVFIETVGVGQDEVDIAKASHTVLVISAPGLGDDIQAIKAGVLEIADIHVVSKSDKPESGNTVNDLRAMLALELEGRNSPDWVVPLITTSVKSGQGLNDLANAIDTHRAYLERSGEAKIRELQMAETRILTIAEHKVRSCLEQSRNDKFRSILEDTVSRRIDPLSAAEILLQDWTEDFTILTKG